MNAAVDLFLRDGCGRCALHATPQCKVNPWRAELVLLRELMLGSSLTEEVKWGFPCYTLNRQNVVIIGVLKESCTLSFFKGALLKDPHHVLTKPGENTQAARLIRFRSAQEIQQHTDVIKEYVQEAIELERAGAKLAPATKPTLEYPAELEQKFMELPALRAAFTALTPGRQRGYLLHFAGAKQSSTRISRIEKCLPAIFEGRGLHD